MHEMDLLFLHIFRTMRRCDGLIIIIIDKHQFQQNRIFTSSQNVVFKICHVLYKIVLKKFIYPKSLSILKSKSSTF